MTIADIIIIISIFGIIGCIGSIFIQWYYRIKYACLNDPMEFRQWLDQEQERGYITR
jgi:hypothetical protein